MSHCAADEDDLVHLGTIIGLSAAHLLFLVPAVAKAMAGKWKGRIMVCRETIPNLSFPIPAEAYASAGKRRRSAECSIGNAGATVSIPTAASAAVGPSSKFLDGCFEEGVVIGSVHHEANE